MNLSAPGSKFFSQGEPHFPSGMIADTTYRVDGFVRGSGCDQRLSSVQLSGRTAGRYPACGTALCPVYFFDLLADECTNFLRPGKPSFPGKSAGQHDTACPDNPFAVWLS